MEAAPKDTAADVRLNIAREILGREASALETVANSLGDDFLEALTSLAGCEGSVVVTGMGKAGLVGQKIAATFCSTGTPSFFLHPAEAIHGDLGRLRPDDRVLALSMSGETEELVRVHAIPRIADVGRDCHYRKAYELPREKQSDCD